MKVFSSAVALVAAILFIGLVALPKAEACDGGVQAFGSVQMFCAPQVAYAPHAMFFQQQAFVQQRAFVQQQPVFVQQHHFVPQQQVFVQQQPFFVANAGANVVNVRGASVAAAPGQDVRVRARRNRVNVRIR